MEQDLGAELIAAQARIKELENRLNQQSDQLRFFVQQAPVAMAMFDKELNYLIASGKYVQDWIGKREYIGESHFELFPDMLDKWKETYRRCLKGVTETCLEDPFKHRDGSVDYIDWVTTPWYDQQNEIGGLILYAERVNERVEDKKKLLRLNRQIKDHKEKLESLVYAISHNLQQPLMACLSVLEFAKESHRQGQYQSIQKRYQYLEATQKRMLASLQDFLAHAQLEEPTGIYPVNLNELIDEICENLQSEIEAKEIDFRVPKLPIIQANEFEMMALFQNIIANAVRHNNQDQAFVQVNFQAEGDFWQFSISDNGAGIPIEKQANIFEYARPVNTENQAHQMGIGLAFCRRIVKSLNGKIWLDSTPQQGTTVSFTLPKESDHS
ncbi:MAG: ATP-binding protein [Bacteroidota bacterium]